MGRPSGHYWVEGYKDYTPDPRPVPAHGVKKKPLRRIRLLDDLPSLDCRAVCERLGIPRVRFIRLRRHPIFPSPVGTDRWGYELWSKRAVDRFAERIAQADEDDPLGYAPPSDDDDDN